MASQVSIYLNETDKYEDRPLHWAILEYLHTSKIAGATVLRAYAGFTGRGPLKTGLGGRGAEELPLVLTFIDSEAHIDEVMPQLAKMAGNRLIVQQSVEVRHGLPKDTASQRIGKLFK
jgi:PII-like signaling protein